MEKVFYEKESEHMNVYNKGVPDKIYLGLIKRHSKDVFFWPDKRGINLPEFIQILVKMIKIKLWEK